MASLSGVLDSIPAKASMNHASFAAGSGWASYSAVGDWL